MYFFVAYILELLRGTNSLIWHIDGTGQGCSKHNNKKKP